MQSLTLITTIVWRYVGRNAFHSFRWASTMVVCVGILVSSKMQRLKPITALHLSARVSGILLLISILLMLISGKLLKGRKNDNTKTTTVSRLSLPITRQIHRDYLYALRTNLLLEPVLAITFAGILSVVAQESSKESMLTNAFSFSFGFTEVYFRLLKMENGRCIILPFQEVVRLKRSKILHALTLVTAMFLLLLVPLCIVSSLHSVLFGYILAAGLFVGNSFVLKLDLERGAGYQAIVSETTQLVYMLLFSAELIIISVI